MEDICTISTADSLGSTWRASKLQSLSVVCIFVFLVGRGGVLMPAPALLTCWVLLLPRLKDPVFWGDPRASFPSTMAPTSASYKKASIICLHISKHTTYISVTGKIKDETWNRALFRSSDDVSGSERTTGVLPVSQAELWQAPLWGPPWLRKWSFRLFSLWRTVLKLAVPSKHVLWFIIYKLSIGLPTLENPRKCIRIGPGPSTA